jgi:hypothetical protein
MQKRVAGAPAVGCIARAVRRPFLKALCLLVLTACADSPADGDRRRQASPGAGSQATGAGSGGTGPDFGNNSNGGSRAQTGPIGNTAPPPLIPPGERQLIKQDECPGTVAADVATRLTGPGVGAGTGRLLYPYDQTVFPRGLTAPVLQWDAPDGGAIMLHFTSQLLDYRICLPLTTPTHLPIPQNVWELAAQQSLGAADPLSVDIVIDAGGSSTRLTKLTILFAIAKLKGAIYYNTYGSARATQLGAVGGVVMRVLPGQPEPDVFLTANDPLNCIGCHAVSADGSRLVAEIHGQPGTFEGPSASYDLGAVGTATNPPAIRSDLSRAGFAGLYPDGTVYVTTARTQIGPIGSLPGTPVGNVPGTFGPEESKLFDTNTGAEIPASGVEPYAYMPTFSVDGTKLVFTQMDTSGMGGHALSVMDFDRATNKFSNRKEVFRDPAQFVGWPFFMPDVVEQRVMGEVTEKPPPARGKRAVFALGVTPDFVTQEQPVGLTPHPSDLWWVDVDSGKAALLSRANGLDPSGAPTMPYGERDAHKNYIPTVSPVAAGGYFWMFFTSKRNYGNLFIADPPELNAEGKKIWVSAIDINAPPGTDPSHPAFFLPGQELESGNIRAFAALEPCRENGTTCETGIDCCCGFCIQGACACKPEDKCAEIDEKCESAADCCDPKASCIGGFCGFVIVM